MRRGPGWAVAASAASGPVKQLRLGAGHLLAAGRRLPRLARRTRPGHPPPGRPVMHNDARNYTVPDHRTTYCRPQSQPASVNHTTAALDSSIPLSQPGSARVRRHEPAPDRTRSPGVEQTHGLLRAPERAPRRPAPRNRYGTGPTARCCCHHPADGRTCGTDVGPERLSWRGLSCARRPRRSAPPHRTARDGPESPAEPPATVLLIRRVVAVGTRGGGERSTRLYGLSERVPSGPRLGRAAQRAAAILLPFTPEALPSPPMTGPLTCTSSVAGAGFEPATSGL